MKLLGLFALIAFLAAPAAQASSTTPWSLADCGPESHEKYQKFEKAVRAASPGSTVYVPKPYPTTWREVIVDYLYQYKGLHREAIDPKSLPENENRVIQGVLDSTVTYEIVRVEDWTPMRCGREQRRDSYFLVRIFDVASGAELSRAALEATGLLAEFRNPTDAQLAEAPTLQRDRLPAPEIVLTKIEAAFGVKGDSPQYVSTWGLNCTPTTPCPAFRNGADVYIYYSGGLFQLPGTGPRLVNGRDVGTPATNEKILKSLAKGERLVTLGGPIWSIAREVKPLRRTSEP